MDMIGQFCRSTLKKMRKMYTKVKVRDEQMGETLVFLQRELYKGRKIIVWAASSHLTYNGKNIEREFYQNNLRQGDYIKSATVMLTTTSPSPATRARSAICSSFT